MTLRHRLPLGLAAILALLLGAAPVARADCEGQALERPFLPWADPAHYVLMPDGDLTAGAAGWQLDGAALVEDNEPWYVHGGDTPRALRLPDGASATTPPLCVSPLHPTVRFFVRNDGGAQATLSVEVLYGDGALPIGTVPGVSAEWAPSAPLPLLVNLVADEVAFRFTAAGPGAAFVIDDVYVDPYKKG